MIARLKALLRQFRVNRDLERSRALLIDELRQIEWRLAMCRSLAVDVHIAHAVAFRALERVGVEPFLSSVTRIQVKYGRNAKAGDSA